jgi:hypothetical protein
MPRCIGTPVRDAARSRRPEYSAHHSIASLSKHADVESLSRHYIATFFDVEDIVFTDGGKVPFDCSGENNNAGLLQMEYGRSKGESPLQPSNPEPRLPEPLMNNPLLDMHLWHFLGPESSKMF